jgi:UDP-N-acetylmuramyl pentapeptide phosphotransferase/UDP-N-acetylglucosamine-1-phosphate transferase
MMRAISVAGGIDASVAIPDLPTDYGPILLAFGAAALATFALAKLAPRIGLVDPAEGGARKLQAHPVPAVGGAALVFALVVVAFAGPGLGGLSGALARGDAFGVRIPVPGVVASVAAVGLAFAVGLLDDVLARGLRAGPKFALQCASGTPLGVGAWLSDGGASAFALPLYVAAAALLAAVALNAANTFDNADGAAAGLFAIALAVPLPAAAGALLGFLPFNLDGRARARDRERGVAPTAYLGDSGSHLVGMLILLTPLAWPALVLPLLDLLRVAFERARVGARPWQGDRRHLAHMALRRGLGRGATLALLVAIAAPALVLGAVGLASGRGLLAVVGAALTLGLYSLALAFASGAPDRRAWRRRGARTRRSGAFGRILREPEVLRSPRQSLP